MKVDVIVKQNFVDDLRAELNTGGLPAVDKGGFEPDFETILKGYPWIEQEARLLYSFSR